MHARPGYDERSRECTMFHFGIYRHSKMCTGSDRLILSLTALSSSVAPEQLHMLRWSPVFIFFLCEALKSHRVHVDEEGCSQTTLQLLIGRRA